MYFRCKRTRGRRKHTYKLLQDIEDMENEEKLAKKKRKSVIYLLLIILDTLVWTNINVTEVMFLLSFFYWPVAQTYVHFLISNVCSYSTMCKDRFFPQFAFGHVKWCLFTVMNEYMLFRINKSRIFILNFDKTAKLLISIILAHFR